MADAGLTVETCLAIEGPGWWVPDFPAWWDDPSRRERILAAIRSVEAEPILLGMGPHFMVVARK